MSEAPTIYILAGPKGSGKTTLAREFLPMGGALSEFFECGFGGVGVVAV